MKTSVFVLGFLSTVVGSSFAIAQSASPELKPAPQSLSLMTLPFLENLEAVGSTSSMNPVQSPQQSLSLLNGTSDQTSQNAVDKSESAQQPTLPAGPLPILDSQNISPLLDKTVNEFAFGLKQVSASKARGKRARLLPVSSACGGSHSSFNGSVLVAQDANILFRKSYGFIDYGRCVAYQPNTPFLLASVTKQFTAALILKEVEEGKISLTDSVTKFISAPASWNSITIQELLSHTAGLNDYLHGLSSKKSAKLGVPRTTDQLLAYIERGNPRPHAGAGFYYSNSGFFVLGKVLEAVTHKSYADLINEKIFTPLNMAHSGILTPAMNFSPDDSLDDGDDNPGNDEQSAKAERIAEQNLISANPNVFFAVGDVFSTLNDLFRWEVALFVDHTFLRADLLEEMHKIQPQTSARLGANGEKGYGFGLHLDKIGDKTIVWHTGHLSGHTTIVEHVLENDPSLRKNDVTIIVLTNTSNAPVRQLANRIAEGVFQAPSIPQPLKLASVKRHRRAGKHRSGRA